MKKPVVFITLTALLYTFVMAGCHSDSSTMMNSNGTMNYGDAMGFGSDSIRSWIKTDANNNPTSVGVTFSEKAFTTLPDHDTTIMLMFPTMMSGGMMSMMAMPFDHAMVDWSAHGDTDPPYNMPFVDCHFNMMSMMGMDSITDGMDSMMPPSGCIPSGYMSDHMSEGMMGVHWYDSTGSEYHGGMFSHTFVYGTHNGKMNFM